MSAARRSSLQDSREKLGEPYQIYSEVVNAGKTVQGTKKKVRWLFGFSNSNNEYEVVLVVSILSGKKVIYEEGKEVANVTSMLNTDFGHGWSSYSTKRLYRVEANLNMNGELSFVLSVDGVPFSDFPQKHQLKRTSTASHLSSGRYGDEVTETAASSTSAHRRASTGSSLSATPASSRPASTATVAASRSNISSAHTSASKSSDAFDPFASSGHNSASFDPFADDFGGASVSTTSTHQAKHGTAPAGSTTVAKPPAASTKTTPTAAAHRASITPKTSSASLLFDEIPAAPSAASATTGGFDAFGDSTDPFAPAPSTNPQSKNNVSFDPFAPSASPAATRSKSAAASFDPFASTPAPAATQPSSADFDPFASTPAPGTAPARRGSALDDLSGLSFNPAPAVNDNNACPAPTVVAPVVEQAPELKEETPKDPWQTNLVDLDLSGKGKESRRSSVNQTGPSLMVLMQQNKCASYNTSTNTMTATSSSTFNNNTMNNNTMNNNTMNNNQFAAPFPSKDPFGAPPLLLAVPSSVNPGYAASSQIPAAANLDALLNNMHRPVSTSDAISSLGGMALAPQPRGSMIMSSMPPPAAVGGGPAPMMGGGFNNNGVRTMSMPMTNGINSNNNIMNGGIGRSSFLMPPSATNGSSNQPKNSLDSLDWRVMK